ncbi:MAG TPA: hypothetical protein VMG38_04975 [Trebonia sp.]|nr:hypothetical protein [Trebonia sp.]
MRRLLRWYGANPLHLLVLLGGFAVAGYAAARLVPSRPAGIAVWFIGAVIGHDLLLFPLYTLADRSAAAVLRHRAARLPAVGWINYLRVPAALSGLLFLVWFPLILRLRTRYQASTTLSQDPYLWHWLGVTGALFLLSAVALALRMRSPRRPAVAPEAQSPPSGSAPPEPPVTGPPPPPRDPLDGGPADGGPADGGPADGGPADGGPADDGAESGGPQEDSPGPAQD